MILVDTIPYRRAVDNLWAQSKRAACIAVALGALSQLVFPALLFTSGVTAALIGRSRTTDAILLGGLVGVALTLTANSLRRRLQNAPRAFLGWQHAAAQRRLDRRTAHS